MTKPELFKKYHINESHSVWSDQIDNHISIEIYRIMHNGELPPPDDKSVMWVCEFLDKLKDVKWWNDNVMARSDGGSLYLTAKRSLYSFADQILEVINN